MSTEMKIPAVRLEAGMVLHDPTMLGTHGQDVKVQWVGHHDRRKRTYVAGVEERSRNPATLAYDDDKEVTVWSSPRNANRWCATSARLAPRPG